MMSEYNKNSTFDLSNCYAKLKLQENDACKKVYFLVCNRMNILSNLDLFPVSFVTLDSFFLFAIHYRNYFGTLSSLTSIYLSIFVVSEYSNSPRMRRKACFFLPFDVLHYWDN